LIWNVSASGVYAISTWNGDENVSASDACACAISTLIWNGDDNDACVNGIEIENENVSEIENENVSENGFCAEIYGNI